MMRTLVFVLALPLPAAAQFAPGSPLPVVDATNDRIVYVSEFDGAPTGATFNLAQFGALDPVHALLTDDLELWVSDRTTDVIYRVRSDGTLAGVIQGGIDDVRGMTIAGSTIYVANRGSAHGAPGPSIVKFDQAGNLLGSFPVPDPTGLWSRSNEIFVGNSAGHDVDRYSQAGTFLGRFIDSDGITGIDVPMQIVPAGCRGHFHVAGDGANPGVYEYDASGNQVARFVTASGVRGVHGLRNGNWIHADANGVHVHDPATGTTTTVLPGIDAWFVGESFVELVTSFAFCHGPAMSCPCMNQSPPGCFEGCQNSLGLGATLQSDGTTSLSGDSVRFHVRHLPDTAPILFFQGTGMSNGDHGITFGDGVRCAGGAVIRLATKIASHGIARYPEPGDAPVSVRGQVTGPGERSYQGWYRNAASFCTASTFNLTNGWRVVWSP